MAGMSTKDFRQTLVCPGCRNYLFLPIGLCHKDYSVCPECRNKLKRCPCCKGFFSGKGRNDALDKMCKIVSPHKCKHAAYGKRINLSQLKKHGDECLHNNDWKCPLLPSNPCQWSGTYKDIKGHLEKSHLVDIRKIIEDGKYFGSSSRNGNMLCTVLREALQTGNDKSKKRNFQNDLVVYWF